MVETASALRGLGLDPSGLVVACRRIVERHPTCGPLWWLCAELLTAPDPHRAVREAVDAITADATAVHLAEALPDGATVATIGWPALAADVEVLAVSTVARVAGPAGVVTCSPAALAAECELAPELLRSSPM